MTTADRPPPELTPIEQVREALDGLASPMEDNPFWHERGVEALAVLEGRLAVCGVVSTSGPNLEPLACGYPKGHEGDHAWATLPTFAELRQAWESFDQAALDRIILGVFE